MRDLFLPEMGGVRGVKEKVDWQVVRERGVCLRKRGVGFEFKAQAPHSKAPLRERGPTDKWKGTGFSGYHEYIAQRRPGGRPREKTSDRAAFILAREEEGGGRRGEGRRREREASSSRLRPHFSWKIFRKCRIYVNFSQQKQDCNERIERRERKREASI